MLDQVQVKLALQYLLSGNHSLVSVGLLCPCDDHGNSSLVKLRSAGSTEHLHDVQVGVLFGASILPGHRILDDDKVAGKIDAGSQR